MKENKINFICDFLNDKEVFFSSMQDEATFKKNSFHDFCMTVYELSQLNLSKSDRLRVIPVIWEVSFLIERFIGRHYNSEDFFEVENLSDDDFQQISEIIYYIANWFSYNKKIEKKYIVIGSWSK